MNADEVKGPAAPKHKKGADVWVPSTKLSGQQPFALMKRRVLGHKDRGRSVLVDDSAGQTVEVSSRLVHADPLGLLLLRVGDLETEEALLDPLSKSVLQYLRLLMSDDAVRSLNVRTASEIQQFMTSSGGAYSHVILVGHGRKDAVKLPGGQWLPVAEFRQLVGLAVTPRVLISLACRTGLTDFGREMTSGNQIKEYIGPRGEVHGASASLYVQQLLNLHLLHSQEFSAAARHANAAIEGAHFNHWRDGKRLRST